MPAGVLSYPVSKRSLDPYMMGFRAFFSGKGCKRNPYTGRGTTMRENRSLWIQGWREASIHPEDADLSGLPKDQIITRHV